MPLSCSNLDEFIPFSPAFYDHRTDSFWKLLVDGQRTHESRHGIRHPFHLTRKTKPWCLTEMHHLIHIRAGTVERFSAPQKKKDKTSMVSTVSSLSIVRFRSETRFGSFLRSKPTFRSNGTGFFFFGIISKAAENFGCVASANATSVLVRRDDDGFPCHRRSLSHRNHGSDGDHDAFRGRVAKGT